MANKSIRALLIFGALLVSGIIFIQSYSAYKNYQLKDIEFNQQVNIALRKVAEKLADYNNSKLPKQFLIQRRSSNYYAVNVNDEIDANILEDFLIREFESQSLNTDFEYAVYDCLSDEMVYGNYCDIGDRDTENVNNGVLPKFEGIEYYFVVRFPSKTGFLIRSLWQTIIFSAITILALFFFIYSTFIILKQKRLSEMQKDFINNMTHEFKTPISSMKIAAEVLSNNEGIKNDERLSKYVDIIKKQNIHLNNQVEKVLDIARVEKDALKLNIEPVNISMLLQEISDSFNLKISDIGGKISLTKPDRDIFVKADKLHLNNVIYNMIDNAIKYYREIPDIQVSLDESTTPILKIQDNGIGIKKEYWANLFNKFYRVPTGNIHDVKGFGLGLYYVKNICDAHGWHIKVESEENIGTEFTIKFTK